MPGKNRKKSGRRLIAFDAETDPFDGTTEIEPFLWGAYDGDSFDKFTNTWDFAEWLSEQNAVAYAHNGGKFDFHFLIPFVAELFHDNNVEKVPLRIVNGRIIEMTFGKATLRDSVAIMPIALKDYKKDDIEYWKLHRDERLKYWDEIVSYLETDCTALFELVKRYREEAGTKATLAANGFAFAKYLDIDPGRTNHHFDVKFRPYYFGGRCEAVAPGTHFDLSVFDIKSAYPFAMKHLHASGSSYTDFGRYWHTLTRSQMQRAFFTVECHSRCAFPKRDRDGLAFPHAFDTYNVTGWEFVCARDHGLISQVKVINCFVFDDTIEFGTYLDHWFMKKQLADKADDKAQRIIAKYMLNSLYGKLCQDPTRYCKHEIRKPDQPPDDGWTISHYGEHFNIHKRETIDEYMDRWGDDWEGRNVYYNVATGSSITGFTRAMLLDAACTVGRQYVVYMDTDSLILRPGAETSRLRQDGELGAWELEGFAPKGWIAGKKLYALELDSGKEKLASKGVRLESKDIQNICQNGATVRWEKSAPTFGVDGTRTMLGRNIKASLQGTEFAL